MNIVQEITATYIFRGREVQVKASEIEDLIERLEVEGTEVALLRGPDLP